MAARRGGASFQAIVPTARRIGAGTLAASAFICSASAALPTVPGPFWGEWNSKLADCGTDLNDSRLIIAGRKPTFYESSGRPEGGDGDLPH